MSTQHPVAEQPPWRAGLRSLSAPQLGNPGPFYFYTLGQPAAIDHSTWVRAYAENEDGSQRLISWIDPGVLYCVRADHVIIDAEVANGKGDGVYERDVQGSPERVTPVPTSPADNKRYLLQTHQTTGLMFIDAFEGHAMSTIRPGLFTRLIRPITFTPDYVEGKPELVAQLKKLGALALYRKMFDQALDVINTADFAAQYRTELQQLYLSAAPEIVKCFRAGETWANGLLNNEDARVKQGAAKGAHYDPLGEYCMYLTGRVPVDQALSRALDREVVVKYEHPEATEARPQIQCVSCGEWSNLVGDRPPRKCRACNEPFEQPEQPKVETKPRK